MKWVLKCCTGWFNSCINVFDSFFLPKQIKLSGIFNKRWQWSKSTSQMTIYWLQNKPFHQAWSLEKPGNTMRIMSSNVFIRRFFKKYLMKNDQLLCQTTSSAAPRKESWPPFPSASTLNPKKRLWNRDCQLIPVCGLVSEALLPDQYWEKWRNGSYLPPTPGGIQRMDTVTDTESSLTLMQDTESRCIYLPEHRVQLADGFLTPTNGWAQLTVNLEEWDS